VVEHRLAKARVASSNLVSRSKPPSGASRVGYGGLELNTKSEGCPAKARYPSGKGEVCKTFTRRFDPDPRLQTFLNKINNPSMLRLFSTVIHRCVFFAPNRGKSAKIGLDWGGGRTKTGPSLPDSSEHSM
jgi:hypothetical protein